MNWHEPVYGRHQQLVRRWAPARKARARYKWFDDQATADGRAQPPSLPARGRSGRNRCRVRRSWPRRSSATVAGDAALRERRPGLVAYPQKRPLIVLTTRPPQLETPFAVFNEGLLTPNDAFFVRYHWSGLPTSIDPDGLRLRVGGNASTRRSSCRSPTSAQVRAGRARRGEPVLRQQPRPLQSARHRRPARQRRDGQRALGGVPLKACSRRPACKAGAKQVTFNGLDQRAARRRPDFVKALDIDHAMDGEVMVAWQMNGADLPMLNGYPVRLVVRATTAPTGSSTCREHRGHRQPLRRLLDADRLSRCPTTTAPASSRARRRRDRPIGRFNVRSFITSLADGARVPAGRDRAVRGIAFDGGQGIARGGVLERWRQDLATARDSATTSAATRSVSGPRRFTARAPGSTILCRCAQRTGRAKRSRTTAALASGRLHAQRHRDGSGHGGLRCR